MRPRSFISVVANFRYCVFAVHVSDSCRTLHVCQFSEPNTSTFLRIWKCGGVFPLYCTRQIQMEILFRYVWCSTAMPFLEIVRNRHGRVQCVVTVSNKWEVPATRLKNEKSLLSSPRNFVLTNTFSLNRREKSQNFLGKYQNFRSEMISRTSKPVFRGKHLFESTWRPCWLTELLFVRSKKNVLVFNVQSSQCSYYWNFWRTFTKSVKSQPFLWICTYVKFIQNFYTIMLYVYIQQYLQHIQYSKVDVKSQ